MLHGDEPTIVEVVVEKFAEYSRYRNAEDLFWATELAQPTSEA
jgi:hypothetical protein